MERVGIKLTEEFYKVEDDEWFEVDTDDFEHKCCDCGLVHTVKFRIDGDELYMSFKRQ